MKLYYIENTQLHDVSVPMAKEGGFTLVELAIVMVIIGLIVGGILKGKEIVDNSRVATTVAQVQGYKAAVTVFRDKYSALPGDYSDAATKLSGCTAACTPAAAGAGDGIVGDINWGATSWAPQLPAAGMNVNPTTNGDETQLFWMHLLKAELISGINDDAINVQTTPEWGVTHPAAKVGGGFVVGQGDGTALNMGNTMFGIQALSGLMLQLWRLPNVSAVNADCLSSGVACILTAKMAANIDRKMDDGKPASGSVQAAALIWTSKCVKTLAVPSPIYLEAGSGGFKGAASIDYVCDLAFALN